eukprot:9299561-Karenia_brevis.AAC.1
MENPHSHSSKLTLRNRCKKPSALPATLKKEGPNEKLRVADASKYDPMYKKSYPPPGLRPD